MSDGRAPNSGDQGFDLSCPVPLADYPRQVLRLARLAARSGMDGVVCSPREIAPLRRALGRRLAIVTPGVRPPGMAAGDQKRVLTPREAVAAGADYLVVARPVLEAAAAALESVGEWRAEAIESALREALVDRMGLKPRVAFAPVRAAVSGRRVSPPLFESLEILGSSRTMRRLGRALHVS